MINKIVKKVQKKKGKKTLTSVKSPEQNQEDIDEEDGQTVDLDDLQISKTQSYNITDSHYLPFDIKKTYRSRSKSESKDQGQVEKKLDMGEESEEDAVNGEDEQENSEVMSLKEEKPAKQPEDFPALEQEVETIKDHNTLRLIPTLSATVEPIKNLKKAKEYGNPSTKKNKVAGPNRNTTSPDQEDYSIPELIPLELVEDFSPLEKMLLSKFREIPDSESTNGLGFLGNKLKDHKKYNQSCYKIVSLIKSFLEEEQIEPEEPEKEFKREEKETAETETKPRTKNEDFKLFNQFYKLKVESKPTRLNKINLGRTHNSKIKIDKAPINEQGYSYKSK